MHIIDHLLRSGQTWSTLLLDLGNLSCGILVVGQIAHLLRIANLVEVMGILKLHGIPVRIATPVLPVLYDGIDGDVALAIFVEHTRQLVRSLVALAALPVTIRPKREHRSLAAQQAHLLHHAVLRTVLIHEVIVDALGHSAAQSCAVGAVAPERLASIVPIDAVAFLAGEIRDIGVRIGVP